MDKPLSTNKKSVIFPGVTDERVEKWLEAKSKPSGALHPLSSREGAKESNMNDNPRKKSKRIVAPILYDKYKDIPRPIKNKLTKDWEPEFVKSLNNPDPPV